jgi:hypothetical protein
MEDIDQCWRKSSYSGNGGECVEVGTPADHDGVAVRDTKDQQGVEDQTTEKRSLVRRAAASS